MDRVSVAVFIVVGSTWFTITFVPILLLGTLGPLLYNESGVPRYDESGLAYDLLNAFGSLYVKTMWTNFTLILCYVFDACGPIDTLLEDHWITGMFAVTALNSLLWATVITLQFVGIRTLFRCLRDLFSTEDPMERIRNLSLWDGIGVLVLVLVLALLPVVSCLVISLFN